MFHIIHRKLIFGGGGDLFHIIYLKRDVFRTFFIIGDFIQVNRFLNPNRSCSGTDGCLITAELLKSTLVRTFIFCQKSQKLQSAHDKFGQSAIWGF